MFSRIITVLLILYAFSSVNLGYAAEENKQKTGNEQQIVTLAKGDHQKKKETNKILLGVKQSRWEEDLYLIPQIKDKQSFLAKFETLENEWYLQDMLESVRRPAETPSLYMYHRPYIQQGPRPELVSSRMIIIREDDVDRLTTMLYKSYKSKPDLTDDESAKLIVYSAGLISRDIRGIDAQYITSVILKEFEKGKSPDSVEKLLLRIRKDN